MALRVIEVHGLVHAVPGMPLCASDPAHLPLQVAVHDALLTRKATVTPLRWATRFAEPYYRLADLLDLAGGTAVVDARAQLPTPMLNLSGASLNATWTSHDQP